MEISRSFREFYHISRFSKLIMYAIRWILWFPPFFLKQEFSWIQWFCLFKYRKIFICTRQQIVPAPQKKLVELYLCPLIVPAFTIYYLLSKIHSFFLREIRTFWLFSVRIHAIVLALYLNSPSNCTCRDTGLKINCTAGTNNDFTVDQPIFLLFRYFNDYFLIWFYLISTSCFFRPHGWMPEGRW